jgi:TolB protein
MSVDRTVWGAARAALAVVAMLLLACPGRAELRLDITHGKVEPLPIAIPAFAGGSGAEGDTGRNIAGVVSNDLQSSGLFRPLDPRSFIQNVAAGEGPRFGDWRQINAQALVTGSVQAQGDGRFRVEFRLWDVFAEQQLTGYAYTTTAQNWRRIAHIIADQVYKRITGEEGYFDTRVVYVAESGLAQNRSKRIAIMDQDGANNQYLTDGRDLVLTPRFSPSAQEIAYLSYANGKPSVYLLSTAGGRPQPLGNFPGMTFAPRYSPDGSRLIFSRSQNGASHIYVMGAHGGGEPRALTSGNQIDTSPSFSNDSSQIVFNSDRGGSQQLYVMNADGGGVHRISFGSGKYGTPVWTPRGDLIAFTKIESGSFGIGIMRPDGSGERLLTQDFLVEGPTWAPNGRVLMYFSQSRTDSGGRKSSRLYTIDLTGYNQHEVKTSGDASDPAWSPLLR